MRDPGPLALRSPLMWGAPIAGLVAGAALWLLAGGADAPTEALDALTGRGEPSAAGASGGDPAGTALSVLASRPIFAEEAVALPRITLIGASRIPGRSAVLVALGGGEPVWIRVGETVDGLTLVSADSGKAVFDSVNGPITVLLGETVEGGAAASPPASAPPETGPPPGGKLPPEPASAPGP